MVRDETLQRAEKYRKGLLERADNDTAEELGFRAKRINGEVFLVYKAEQVVVPGLGGEALLSVYNYAVRQRYKANVDDRTTKGLRA